LQILRHAVQRGVRPMDIFSKSVGQAIRFLSATIFAWRSAFAFQSWHFVSSHVAIHFPIIVFLWQSNGKVEKFYLDF
jgi:hypothetical protein